jgi:L-amino acid N-acyltransferase
MQKNQRSSSLEIKLRPAVEPDLKAMNDIYNYYVLQSTCTYQEEPELLSDRKKWFSNHDQKYPATVAACNEQVVGWSSLSPYHKRSAYRHTVENSIYVRHDWHRRGMGSLLLQDLIQKARTLGYHSIIAGIDSDQASSIALHAKYDFQQVAHLRQVGYKFNRWLDVIYMELLL